MSPVYECQDCGKHWDVDKLLAIKDIFERVAPGEPMPSGECPACGALCHAAELTEREKEIVRLAARGLPEKAMATALDLSPNTVHNHLTAARKKAGAANRTQLTTWAIRNRARGGFVRYKCPQCGRTDRLDIYATVQVRLTQHEDAEGNSELGTDADLSGDGSHFWDDDSQMDCTACGWGGTVREAEVEDDEDTCRTCHAALDDDGFDGECGSCADKKEAKKRFPEIEALSLADVDAALTMGRLHLDNATAEFRPQLEDRLAALEARNKHLESNEQEQTT